MKSLTSSEIEQEYSILKSGYEKLINSLLIQLNEILADNNITLGFPIQYRIKRIDSLLEKVENGRFTIKKSIREVQDIAGLRIILIFKKDVEKVCELINNNLKVIKQYNSEEKLMHNQFGYSSEHFVIKIPTEWSNVPTFKGLDDFQVEIQLRTLSQHTWAEASQKLQYKHEDGIPRQLIRSIGRVSALLETVDLEFERLLSEREIYKQEIIHSKKSDLILDVDILANILNDKLPEINKSNNENYAALIKDLKIFDINTKEKLENLISKNLEKALNVDREYSKRNLDSKNIIERQKAEKEAFFTFVGLVREILDVEFKEDWRKYNRQRTN